MNTAALLAERPVTALRGVGPALAELLAKLGLHTVQDVLFHLPLRYEDRTRVVPIGALRNGDRAVIEGEIQLAEVVFRRRRMLLVRIADGTGFVTLRFFHFSGAQQAQLVRGQRLRCFGEARLGPGGLEIVHPEYRRVLADASGAPPDCLTPIYPTTEGVQQGRLRMLTDMALAMLSQGAIQDYVPPGVLDAFDLPPLEAALRYVHRPPPDANVAELEEGRHPAQRRLAFEELLAHQLSLRLLRQETDKDAAWPLPRRNDLAERCLASLPFRLTGAQSRVWAEIAKDLERPHPMMRLVQGDVGSGKTVVAALAAVRAVEHGAQAAVMAPTELLAEQHARNFNAWLEPLGVRVALLTGRQTGKVRAALETDLASGSIQVAVGTHALFQEGIEFQRLVLAIVDEQHRFGVHQRLQLREKGQTRRPVSAPAGDDRHADSAHAGHDGVCGPRRLDHRRAAAGTHADQDGGAAGHAAQRHRRAHRHGLPVGTPGVLGVPADRRIRSRALRGRGENRGATGRSAAGRAHRPDPRAHGGQAEGRGHDLVQAGQARPAGRDDGDRGGRGRAQREPDGHRERRAHGTRPAAPVARPRGSRLGREHVRPALPGLRCRPLRASGWRSCAKRTTASRWRAGTSNCAVRANCWARARRA